MTNPNKYHPVPETGFLRVPQILAIVPVSRATWWQWVKDGKAPKARKIGPRITAWKAEEIHAFLAQLDRGDNA